MLCRGELLMTPASDLTRTECRCCFDLTPITNSRAKTRFRLPNPQTNRRWTKLYLARSQLRRLIAGMGMGNVSFLAAQRISMAAVGFLTKSKNAGPIGCPFVPAFPIAPGLCRGLDPVRRTSWTCRRGGRIQNDLHRRQPR